MVLPTQGRIHNGVKHNIKIRHQGLKATSSSSGAYRESKPAIVLNSNLDTVMPSSPPAESAADTNVGFRMVTPLLVAATTCTHRRDEWQRHALTTEGPRLGGSRVDFSLSGDQIVHGVRDRPLHGAAVGRDLGSDPRLNGRVHAEHDPCLTKMIICTQCMKNACKVGRGTIKHGHGFRYHPVNTDWPLDVLSTASKDASVEDVRVLRFRMLCS